MKTIGILGGIGPQATMALEAQIHAVAQELIPPDRNAGYPPLMVLYLRHAPLLLSDDGVTPVLPLSPDPRLLQAAETLGSRADFIIIASNTPHLFRQEIEQAAGQPVLSMVDLAVAEAQRRKPTRVGVLGLGDPTVYRVPLDQQNIAYEIIPADLRERLDRAIWALMEGREDRHSRAAAIEAVAYLRARDVDVIILGCTEIPLLLGDDADAPDLIDPSKLLAEAAVRHALD